MRTVTLGEVCSVVSGSTPKRNKAEYWNGNIPWITPKEISRLSSPYLLDSEEKITKEGFGSCSTSMLPVGSVLLSSRAPIGLLAINKIPVCTNQGFKSLIPSKEVNSEYLYYVIKANVQALQARGNGATFKELAKPAVEKFEIPLPPINDQIRIAYLLGKVEGLIAQRKQNLQQLDNLLKSVFLEMFGDPVRNEKGWETSELENLCAQVIDCPHSTPVYSDEETGYYCIRSGDIVDGYLDLTKTLQVENRVYEERIKRYTPKHNDIVYSREGGRLGNAARILGAESICLGQRIMLFKTGEENCAEFLWALLESRQFKAKLQGLVGGGAAPRVNIKDLKNIIVIKPALEIQEKFADIVKHVDSIKSRYVQSLSDLESLYGALSQQAFKGELDLSRVPLPDENEKPKADESAQENIEISIPLTDFFQIPAAAQTADVTTKEGRSALLKILLSAWVTQFSQKPFVLDDFVATAQNQFWKLTDGEYQLGSEDYETIKSWVFDALNIGLLQQAQNVTGHEKNGKPIFGNLIELKAGIQS